ncbi:unnamed protein product [Trichobilharzia regenti]|nr:unnamed protein product [Trichobilharzia regenti]
MPVGGASINVEGLNHVVNSTPYFGDYWRLLPPTGIFHVWASKIGAYDQVRQMSEMYCHISAYIVLRILSNVLSHISVNSDILGRDWDWNCEAA